MSERSSLDVMSRSTKLLFDMALEIVKIEPVDARATILAATALRVVRIADSIAQLYEHCRYEEMSILLRSLTEAIINAAYLKIADAQEAINFLRFDYAKTWDYALKLEAHMNLRGTPLPLDVAARSEVQRGVEEATKTIRRDPRKSSWSIYSLHQRAELADKAGGDDDFVTLKVSTWDFCHTYVHSTFSTYEDCIEWLKSGAFPSDAERLESTETTMVSTNHALWIYCEHLNTSFNLQYGDRIDAITDLSAKLP